MNIKSIKLPAVRRAMQQLPWAIQEDKLSAMLEAIELHAGGGSFTAEELQARIGAGSHAARSGAAAKVDGSIAVLPIYGVIAQRMNMMMQFSGGTSSELFGRDFDAAVNDPAIGAIVIDVDSPGGSVAGTPELARKIFDARGSKPIIAVANSLMASAAYWIGSAADELVATPSAEGVGSIGVIAVHEEFSKAAEMAGFKFTIIRAPENKGEGNPYEALSPEALEFIQGQIDEFYGMFVNAVAKHRGIKASDVREKYGSGRAFSAKQALAAGMIDRIATLDDVIAKLGGSRGTAGKKRAAATLDETGRPVAIDTIPTASEERRTEPTEEPSQTPAAPSGQGEETVETPTPAQPGAEATRILAAERKRVAAIQALCQQENMPAAVLNELIESGATEDQASTRILAEVRKARAGAPTIRVGADREADRPFKSFGEQLVAVVQAGKPGGGIDKRLTRVNHEAMQIAAGPSGMNEGTSSEGGYFVQPDLLPGVIDPVYKDDPILSRVTRIPTTKSTVKYNVVDESARTDGNRWGGIAMNWVAEAGQGTAKKPKLREMQLDLKKLIGLAFLTDELTEDAPAAEALLTRAFQAELRFMLAIAIFRGTGAGQPLGFENAGCKVVQAIEGGQTIANSAASLALNTSKMLSRIPAALWDQTIFLYNQELLPYLQVATLGGTTVGAFTAAGGATNRPFDTIWGKPAFASEICQAVGTIGDIAAVVPSEYHMIDKGGPKQSTSVHLRFDYDEMALKVTYRVDGAPVWKDAVTPYKGANTRSPFVLLNTRA